MLVLGGLPRWVKMSACLSVGPQAKSGKLTTEGPCFLGVFPVLFRAFHVFRSNCHMTTYMANSNTVQRKWTLIDAADKTLGRLASDVARRLRGKHKADYTPHVDVGDYVIVINADKLTVTGRKENDKLYYRHSGYNGGLKTATFAEMQKKHPGRVFEIAVKGMLPKGPLGRQMFRKLKVYSGSEHQHQAQQPQKIED